MGSTRRNASSPAPPARRAPGPPAAETAVVRLLRRWRFRRSEMLVVGVIGEGLVAFRRQSLGIIERALNVLAPHLARQFVQHLDAVAVRVADIEAVGHAVIDAAMELDALFAQPSELFQPG